MKIYISNAFSLSMLDRDSQSEGCQAYHGTPRTPRPVTVEEIHSYLESWAPHAEIVSVIGHEDTAAVLGDALGLKLNANRVSVKLRDSVVKPEGVFRDLLFVGQYIGPRLPEGATKLPTGAVIEWWLI